MPSTTNFGWTTPADTDLVKDGASAIRTLGNGIDTSFVDLKGGTTGQVLAKATNADLDFTWTNGGDITSVVSGVGISGGGTSGDVTITNSMATAIDAKGDLIVGTAADTFSRLAIGSNDQVLTADSTAATGMKWATPASGGMTLLSTTSLAGVSTVTISSISQAYNHLEILIEDFDFAANDKNLAIRFNSDTGSNYFNTASTANTASFTTFGQLANWSATNEGAMVFCDIPFYSNSSISKVLRASYMGLSSTGAGYYVGGACYATMWKATPAAITSVTIFNQTDSVSFDAGSVKIYGVK